jgi:outer membrane protein assembly complex protein YaeT
MSTGVRNAWLVLLLAAGCRSTAVPVIEVEQGDALAVTFEGVEHLDEKDLLGVVTDELASLDGRAIDKAAVDDAAYAIELFYRSKGHDEVMVDYDYDPESGGARFIVNEGARVTVERFDVHGAALDSELIEFLCERQKPGSAYVREVAHAIVGRLREAHRARGYLAAEVAGPEVEMLGGERVALSATIAPGAVFVVRALDIEGALPALAPALERATAAYVDQVYTPHVGFGLRSLVVRYHEAHGYPDCSATLEVDEDAGTGAVRLVIGVAPGPLVVIAKVRVQGNVDIDEDRVLSRIELAPGERYDPEQIEESFRRLYATGLFDSVRLYLEERTGTERTLVAEVVESPTLELFAEPGWGSYEGPRIRVGLDERNLLGSGRRGKLETHLSPLDTGVELLVSDPWLFSSALTGQATLFWNERQEPSFTHSEVGGGLSVRRAWNSQLSTTLGYELSLSELTDVEVGSTLPPELVEDVDIGSIVFSLTRNTRDNVLLPTRGSTQRFYTSLATDALASEAELFELGFDLTRVVSLGETTVVSGSARVSTVTPFGSTTEVPLQRRKFNGGENTVRSFLESELGPVDPVTGEPIGGEAMTVFSLELRQQLAGNVSGALFWDTGTVAPRYEDVFDSHGFRHGIGLGVRYLLPIGPMRLDFAVNPDPRGQEDDWALHFAVGLPF